MRDEPGWLGRAQLMPVVLPKPAEMSRREQLKASLVLLAWLVLLATPPVTAWILTHSGVATVMAGVIGLAALYIGVAVAMSVQQARGARRSRTRDR